MRELCEHILGLTKKEKIIEFMYNEYKYPQENPLID